MLVIKNLCKVKIRQRGEVGGSAKKIGLRIKELERLYGIELGSNRYEKNSHLKSSLNPIPINRRVSTELCKRLPHGGTTANCDIF